MTDFVTPSPGAFRSYPTSGAVRYGSTDQRIVPDTEDHFASYITSIEGNSLAAGPFNAFDATWTGLDLTIKSGEAYVMGKYLARDTKTTFTIPDNTTTTYYLGWPADTGHTVIIGESSAFPSNHEKVPIWEFSADSGNVVAHTDHRVFNPEDIDRVKPDETIPRVALEDGESAEFSIPVKDGETVVLTGWGAVDQDNLSPSALSVNFIDETYTVQHANSVAWEENSDGLHSLTNNTGSLTHFRFRVINNTGSDYVDPDGVTAAFAWRYE